MLMLSTGPSRNYYYPVKKVQNMTSDYPVVSPERIEKFLAFLANDGGEKLLTKFAEFFPADFESRILAGRVINEAAVEIPPSDALAKVAAKHQKRGSELTLKLYSIRLRRIWIEQAFRERQWRMLALRYQFHSDLTDQTPLERQWWGLDTIPPNDPLEQAMVYMDRHFERFRYCKNPECPAPFYISSTKKPTKFCSPVCASPAKREARLRWYHANQAAKGKKHVTHKAR